MGTRHLTVVQHGGEYKVAQYGQWDGYPEGQGAVILQFLHEQFEPERFIGHLAQCEVVTGDHIKELHAKLGADPDSDFVSYDISQKFAEKHPSLSRDTGAEVLSYIQEGPVKLFLDLEFAGNSLMCEYAYVLDLDKKTFEVYRGFNTENKDPNGRFSHLESYTAGSGSTYYPVSLWHSFDLKNLPAPEEFLATFAEEEEAEA